jgi:hypothetical protein
MTLVRTMNARASAGHQLDGESDAHDPPLPTVAGATVGNAILTIAFNHWEV